MKAPLLASGPAQLAKLQHAQAHPDPDRRPHNTLKRKHFVYDAPKPIRLRADCAAGVIWYGEELLLAGIPAEAWRYHLGNRSALEWVIDQYQERAPKDPTIRAHFNTYRLADHLEEVAMLLAKVATVSVETMRIVDGLAGCSAYPPTNASKPIHSVSAPATPQAVKQLLLDFSQPVEPAAPPATLTLALTRDESDFYLLHYQGSHDGDALECLMQRHGHSWDARVQEYDVTQYWQGPKARPGSWISNLVCTPHPIAPATHA